MSSIRPLERDDLTGVASLYERVMRSGSPTPPPGLGAYLGRMVLDHPWADPELPSLVSTSRDGAVEGFIGSHVRRLRFDGKPLRLRYSEWFVTDPAVRERGVGALLLRSYLAGPQDLTITDTAAGPVRRMWERLGGMTAPLPSIGWVRFFRPFRFASDYLLERSGNPSWKRAAHPVTALLDGGTRRVPAVRLQVQRPSTRDEELVPRALLDHLACLTDGLRLRPDYDKEFLDWLFAEMSAVTSRGALVRRLVSAPDGRVLGWYVAYLPAGGVGEVVQLVAPDDDVDAVLEHLLHDAWRSGATLLRGRLEPRLFEPVARRRCYLRPSGTRVLVHARDPEVTAALALGQALLTKMEGTWWMGHLVEPFTSKAPSPR
ncbi:MAG TPA: hypothetical protein VGC06_25895 [Actinomycetes bacterium]